MVIYELKSLEIWIDKVDGEYWLSVSVDTIDSEDKYQKSSNKKHKMPIKFIKNTIGFLCEDVIGKAIMSGIDMNIQKSMKEEFEKMSLPNG